MSNIVSWNLQLSVREGRLDDVRVLMAEMVEVTGEESGANRYEWFLSGDGKSCHILESYDDSDAAMIHIGNFGSKFAERFLEYLELTAMYVYGEPSADVRGALDGFGAAYLGALGGFTR